MGKKKKLAYAKAQMLNIVKQMFAYASRSQALLSAPDGTRKGQLARLVEATATWGGDNKPGSGSRKRFHTMLRNWLELLANERYKKVFFDPQMEDEKVRRMIAERRIKELNRYLCVTVEKVSNIDTVKRELLEEFKRRAPSSLQLTGEGGVTYAKTTTTEYLCAMDYLLGDNNRLKRIRKCKHEHCIVFFYAEHAGKHYCSPDHSNKARAQRSRDKTKETKERGAKPPAQRNQTHRIRK